MVAYKIRQQIRSVFNRIKNATTDHLHMFFFELYINHPGALYGGWLAMLLPKNVTLSDSSHLSLWIPNLWTKRFTEALEKRSVLYPHLRNRTGITDRIVQPSIASTERIKDHKGETVVVDTFSQIVIDLKTTYLKIPLERANWQPTVSLSLMDLGSDQLADLIDSSIMSRKANEKSGFESIFDNEHTTGHESLGMKTVAGYVVSKMNDHDRAGTTFNDTDAWKEALFHLPQGYRTRAQWYMHPDIGLYIGTLSEREDDGTRHYLAHQGDNIQSDGTPVEVFNKPIIYNSKITGREFIAVFGDLSRGYIVGALGRMWLTINNEDGYHIGLRTGGQILQPAAIKVVRAPWPVAQEIKRESI